LSRWPPTRHRPYKVEAILRQIELHQREVSGDGMPYGLNLMLRALGAATHYGDAVAALDLEPVIATLRERVKDRNYIPGLIRRLLLDNPHRVRLVVAPDTASRPSVRRRQPGSQSMKDASAASTPEKFWIWRARLRERVRVKKMTRICCPAWTLGYSRRDALAHT
jgi:Zn-dependent M16 (insulinase) family peptidase